MQILTKVFFSLVKCVCCVLVSDGEPECLKFSRLCPRAGPGWAGLLREGGPSYEEQ